MSINRNILECKDRNALFLCQIIQCINRNILECKGIFPKICDFSASGINRNILECKDFIEGTWEPAKIVLIETYWNVKSEKMKKEEFIKLY